MKRKFWLILSFIILILSAPWLFADYSEYAILGFPPWAFTSVLFSVLYVLVLFILLHFYWKPDQEQDNKNEGDQ